MSCVRTPSAGTRYSLLRRHVRLHDANYRPGRVFSGSVDWTSKWTTGLGITRLLRLAVITTRANLLASLSRTYYRRLCGFIKIAWKLVGCNPAHSAISLNPKLANNHSASQDQPNGSGIGHAGTTHPPRGP